MAKVAAFFDVDGTLLAKHSASLYVTHLRRTGQARRRDALRTLYYLAQYKLGMLDVESAMAVSMRWVAGREEAALAEDCRSWYATAVRQWIYPEMAVRVRGHQEAGHLTALLTSATRYLAEPLGADLGVAHHLVTRLEVREGRFTGKALRPVCYGAGKVYWAERFAEEHGVDLRESFFYTDSITDRPVLERVGHPVVVHPDPRLARLAAQRGWPVLRPKVPELPAQPGGAVSLSTSDVGHGKGGEGRR